MKKRNKFSISIILPFLNEINSLKKTIAILEKIKFQKEYIIIFSNELTNKKNKFELQKLKKSFKNLRYFSQLKPFVGGAIDLGIKKSKLEFIAIMASDLETNPNELIKLIRISLKNLFIMVS